MRIINALIWISIAYKIGDWRHLNKYYPTLLFWGLGNCMYDMVFYNKPLWLYVDPIFKSHILVSFINLFVDFFCVLIIFLYHFPSELYKRIVYILFWAFIFTGIEYFFFSINHFAYYNGWNIGYSLIHNLYQFPLLSLHYKNHPVLAWIISLALLIAVAFIFKLPFSIIR